MTVAKIAFEAPVSGIDAMISSDVTSGLRELNLDEISLVAGGVGDWDWSEFAGRTLGTAAGGAAAGAITGAVTTAGPGALPGAGLGAVGGALTGAGGYIGGWLGG